MCLPAGWWSIARRRGMASSGRDSRGNKGAGSARLSVSARAGVPERQGPAAAFESLPGGRFVFDGERRRTAGGSAARRPGRPSAGSPVWASGRGGGEPLARDQGGAGTCGGCRLGGTTDCPRAGEEVEETVSAKPTKETQRANAARNGEERRRLFGLCRAAGAPDATRNPAAITRAIACGRTSSSGSSIAGTLVPPLALICVHLPRHTYTRLFALSSGAFRAFVRADDPWQHLAFQRRRAGERGWIQTSSSRLWMRASRQP